jgi:hypothetical protein
VLWMPDAHVRPWRHAPDSRPRNQRERAFLYSDDLVSNFALRKRCRVVLRPGRTRHPRRGKSGMPRPSRSPYRLALHHPETDVRACLPERGRPSAVGRVRPHAVGPYPTPYSHSTFCLLYVSFLKRSGHRTGRCRLVGGRVNQPQRFFAKFWASAFAAKVQLTSGIQSAVYD